LSILVTGGSGMIGKAFTQKMLEKGKTVYSLSRHAIPEQDRLKCLIGDILEPDLGLTYIPKDIEAVYHIAGVVNLSKFDKNGSIWATNAIGTENAVEFCLKHKVPHLYYCSSAFSNLNGCNPYEKSKAFAEDMVRNSKIEHVTIFKPGIVLGPPDHCHLEHLSQYALLMSRLHKRADLVRRKIEGSLHLPVIEPLFHLRGIAEGELNVVDLASVVKAMSILDGDGTYWLTNPKPPSVGEIAKWMGTAALLKVVVAPEFNETPIEYAFERLSSAFAPYLQGRVFPSDIYCPIITEETIVNMVLGCLKQ